MLIVGAVGILTWFRLFGIIWNILYLRSIDELKINQSPDETMNSGIALFCHMQPSNIRVCCEVAAGNSLIFLLGDIISGNSSYLSEAHLSGQAIQNWISQNYNILIQFTYEPERPVIDEFTELLLCSKFIFRRAYREFNWKGSRYEWTEIIQIWKY
jgi:hypothetical protein